MKKYLFLILIGGVLVSCSNQNKEQNNEKNVVKDSTLINKQAILEKAKTYFKVLPDSAPNPENILTPEKVELGKKLYYDNLLSLDKTQSCNTCHNLDTYGVDNKPTSKGDKGENGTRNSPTVLNVALHIAQFWDGREPDVEAQAGGPVLNPVEMAMPSEEAVVKRLSEDKTYPDMFKKAFPDDNNAVSFENMKKAIGAFERTLLTPSKFDDFLNGNADALNENELKGLDLFINKSCVTCHSGVAVGGQMFMKFGIFGNYWDYTKSEKIDNGKFDVTKNEADKYIFKVPSLRNIEKTYPYFHDGSVNNLNDAVKIMAKAESNIDLSDEEVNFIVTFLKTLTGKVPDSAK